MSNQPLSRERSVYIQQVVKLMMANGELPEHTMDRSEGAKLGHFTSKVVLALGNYQALESREHIAKGRKSHVYYPLEWYQELKVLMHCFYSGISYKTEEDLQIILNRLTAVVKDPFSHNIPSFQLFDS